MSAFKRMQSKVFWSHMADQDPERSPLVASIVDTDSPRRRFSGACRNLAMHSDDSDASVTAITIDECTSQRGVDRSPSEKSRSRDAIDGTVVENETVLVPAKKWSSSPCDRSLDSGFSDSERSNSPDIDVDGTPRRRQRRRRTCTRERALLARRLHRRLSSLWKNSERPPHPAHTSTPKPERHPRGLDRSVNPERIGRRLSDSSRHVPRQRMVEEEGERASTAVVSSSPIDEECLGDFLYAREPPEDEEEHATSIVSSSRRTRGEASSHRSTVDPRTLDERTAVRAWLRDLVTETEGECWTTLQSKTLPRRKFFNETTSSATAAATELLVRADGFARHLQRVVERISESESERTERELLRAIEEEAFSIVSELGAPPPRRIQRSNRRAVPSQLESLGSYVDEAVDARLDFYIERVVRGLEDPPPGQLGSATRGALAALTALGLAGNRAGASIARSSGIRALLTCLISAGRLSSDLRAATLRALASVCCCPPAIEEFVREDGPEILLDLLAAETTPETEKMEATALVVQITAPWTDALGLRHLEPFATELIVSLTRLAERTVCAQTLLLAAAAFNNLAGSTEFVAPILKHDSVRTLLRCVKKSVGGNVWLMEQVASLIGKLAKIPETRCHLARARASVALVCFLRMRPPGLEDAYRRLEITAAEALTRLCVEPEIARQVVAVGGADCLPSYDDDDTSSGVDERAGLPSYTKSLRRACKRAAREIDVAKSSDYGLTG